MIPGMGAMVCLFDAGILAITTAWSTENFRPPIVSRRAHRVFLLQGAGRIDQRPACGLLGCTLDGLLRVIFRLSQDEGILKTVEHDQAAMGQIGDLDHALWLLVDAILDHRCEVAGIGLAATAGKQHAVNRGEPGRVAA